MNEIVNKFLLAGDKFMHPRFTYSVVDHSLKINKEFKNLKKLETHAIFTKMSLIRHVFGMIWLKEILTI